MRRAMVGRRLQSSLFLVCSASFVRPASSFAPRQCSTSLSSSPFLKFSTCSRLFSASSMDSEVSASNSMKTTTTRHDSICVGGDFAGLKATFSPKDGALIPIPEYLVPEALLEWGQEPSSLEVLVSEEEEEETEQSGLKERQTICVLPAIGCGVDNLETQKTQQEFSTETTSYSKPSDSTLTLDTTTTLPSGKEGRVHQTETLFSLPDSHRVRISLNLQVLPNDSAFSYQIQSPIVMYLERQTNTTSNRGTRADGGGLDGRTVSTLLGDWLRLAHNFGKNKPLQWKPEKEDVTATITSVIHLPENVTIASGPAEEADTFMLQLSHFSKEGSRRTIERTFQGLESAASVQYREDSGKCLPSGE
ncbi:expressed unknown protein [Seminavis robusta]|uniref:Uncharacterized protein n=1 Tax=Seminavis robusta TaxID=568900 RepID=A0A9N8DUP1_9STRA|nr:expressed unknown protein [Seminavis robusta]|eukprot:Sro355_g125170.1 n/a (362) ;mRNA; f:69291-70376